MDPFNGLNKKLDDIAAVFETRMLHFEQAQVSAQSSSDTAADLPSVKLLSEDYKAFKEFVTGTLSALKLQLEVLRAAQDQQETHSRRKILLFHGMPEDGNEDTTSMILSVLMEQIKLTGADPSVLESCHRLGARQTGRTRPVLVRFSSLHARNTVWNSKSSLKGSGVSVSEFLTRPRHEAYTSGRKHFGMAHCWSMDGVVVVLCPDKTRQKIVSMTEMQTLISKFPLAIVAEAQKKEKTVSKAKVAPKQRERRAFSKKV